MHRLLAFSLTSKIYRQLFTFLFIFWVYLILPLSLAIDVDARPGGGSRFRSGRSWSGGSSNSHGSGGSYSGGLGRGGGVYVGSVNPTFVLVTLIVFVLVIYFYSRQKNNDTDELIVSSPEYEDLINRKYQVNNTINNVLKSKDPNFSTTIFLDFVQLLFTNLQYRRGKPSFWHLKPYVNETILRDLERKTQQSQMHISEIVIGGIEISEVKYSQSSNQIILLLEIDYNYTEKISNESILRVNKLDKVIFAKKSDVLSPEPEKIKTLSCPNCGSTLELNINDECLHCGTIVQPGEKQWKIENIININTSSEDASEIAQYTQEVGNSLPVIVDPNLDFGAQEFCMRHNIDNFSNYWSDFSNSIVPKVFYILNESWTNQKWETVRPIISDNLFTTQHYWIEFYKSQGIRTILKDVKLIASRLVKIECDKFYDSFTVLVQGSSIDYLETKNGKLITGNKSSPREYREYWTFIRRAHIQKTVTEFNPNTCPSCGAPAQMGQAGICEYCGSKVTQGDFDWILSRITQDEAYFG